jgi:N-acetylmuramic acid 6-phosphate etherase
VPAIAHPVFLVPTLQEQAGLFIALLLQIMQKGGMRTRRQGSSQFVDLVKKRYQAWLLSGGGHGLNGLFQFENGGQNIPFGFVHIPSIAQILGRTKRISSFEKATFGKMMDPMKRSKDHGTARLYLGIEGGATQTSVGLADANGSLLKQFQIGPANVRLLSDSQLIRHLQLIRKNLEGAYPSAAAIGMAGARNARDRSRIQSAAAKVWPGCPVYPTHDLETALTAAGLDPFPARPGGQSQSWAAEVLILSGTGSCCFGRNTQGNSAKIGGWGHQLGDKGSGYEIGLRAMKAALYYYDRDGQWPALGERILRALQLNEPEDLIDWVQSASKAEVAALTPVVFAAKKVRDRIASDILEGAAHGLAKDALDCARRVAKPGQPVHFVQAGSVLLNQPAFARKIARWVREHWPRARVSILRTEGFRGAIELARRLERASGDENRKFHLADRNRRGRISTDAPWHPSLDGLASSPTEQRNPRSMNLDKLPLSRAIELMLNEEAKVPAFLWEERKAIERGIRLIVRAFRRGGKLYYVGAGTSGRLGVLDASECPPTFCTPPELVQGIMAGGHRALWESVEGAEDDPQAGAGAVSFRGVNHLDVVVGIAASGRTPFVWGALQEAERRGAATILLAFNPRLRIPVEARPRLLIVPNVGPEILTGSTRLKAGTATKLVLNMFTTLAMVRTGKVLENLMVDLQASNAKLRDRAVRTVRELTGTDEKGARLALEKAGWNIRKACRQIG